jgi:hypothetical protein
MLMLVVVLVLTHQLDKDRAKQREDQGLDKSDQEFKKVEGEGREPL